MFTISGGVCAGYMLMDADNQGLPLHFTQMWDAILVRDKLNRGEWKLAPTFERALEGYIHPPVVEHSGS